MEHRQQAAKKYRLGGPKYKDSYSVIIELQFSSGNLTLSQNCCFCNYLLITTFRKLCKVFLWKMEVDEWFFEVNFSPGLTGHVYFAAVSRTATHYRPASVLILRNDSIHFEPMVQEFKKEQGKRKFRPYELKWLCLKKGEWYSSQI